MIVLLARSREIEISRHISPLKLPTKRHEVVSLFFSLLFCRRLGWQKKRRRRRRTMCCSNLSLLYRGLPYLHASIGFLEMVLGIARLAIYFSPLTVSGRSVAKIYSHQYVVAFIVDWISSVTATLIGVFVILLILVGLMKCCVCCLKGCKHLNNSSSSGDVNTSGLMRGLLRNKAIRRFLIIDCNCPCYKARPKQRFIARFALLFLFFVLRLVAIGLYARAPDGDNDGGLLAGLCALSLLFLFLTLGLDFYRYCVWWHYTPEDDPKCCGRSRKHERYLPYHMVGKERDLRTLGDRPCTDQPCHERRLDHIAVFHGNDYQPQQRWIDISKPRYIDQEDLPKKKYACSKSEEIDNQPHYIGFHTTTPEAAIGIASSEFRPGKNGWLGPGVYFARSIAGTIGKAKIDVPGAHLIVEIRMGKVYVVDQKVITRKHHKFDQNIFDYVHHGAWQKDYHTCYMIHEQDHRDEFAIRDAKSQIVKWVIVVNEEFDPKVEKYQLPTEFDSTRCWCI